MLRIKIAIFFIIVILLFINTSNTLAQNNVQTGQNINIYKGQIVNGNYFVSGNNIIISGVINGDLYTAGENITIDGEVNGDLIALGGTININGKVDNNIRAIAGNINISGNVGKNISILSGNLITDRQAVISGDLIGAGGNFIVNAPISKNITVACTNLIIANNVKGDVLARVNNLNLDQNSNISGKLTYWSPQAAKIQNGANIIGSIKYNKTQPNEFNIMKGGQISTYIKSLDIIFRFIWFVSLLILGTAFINYFPEFSNGTSYTILIKFWRSLFIGILTILITPLVIIFLLFIIFTIPLSILTIILYTELLYFSQLFVSFSLGKLIVRFSNKKFSFITQINTYIIGLICYTLLTLIPLVGTFISFFSIIIGTGGIIIEIRNYYNQLRSNKLA